MEYITFLLVNAVLYLRPQEIVPELEKVPIYYFVILTCLGFSFIRLVQLVFYSPLIWHPTVILSIVMAGLAAISLGVNKDFGEAMENEIEFLKILVYFLLFLAVITTPDRLRGVIACVAVCMTVTAFLAILHYHDIIQIEILKLQETIVENSELGTEESIRRLRFTGILHDPNEVGVFLSMLGFLCLYQLTDAKLGALRFLWLIPIAVFLYALALTSSRGGLLSMLVGLTVFAVYKYRAKKAIFVLMLVVPVIFIAFAGRQTSISTNAGTAQTRFGLWDDWFQEFRQNPIIGVGPGIGADTKKDNKVDWLGTKHCAHNSYLQPFADMGFLGGVCFLGAIGIGLITVHRYGFNKTTILDPELARLQPYLMGALACYAMGFLTLTLNYVIPTFFVLVLPVAYYGMTPCLPPVRRPSLTVDSLIRLGVAGVGFLAFTYVMVRVMPKS